MMNYLYYPSCILADKNMSNKEIRIVGANNTEEITVPKPTVNRKKKTENGKKYELYSIAGY